MNFKKLNNLVGWVAFAIVFAVYFMTAERTGSLWDCGEFVSAAYKMQVVHPPGAPLFLLIGRMFAWVGSLTSNPSNIAYAVNMMSGMSGAFSALFLFWITTGFAKLALVGRNEEPTDMGTIVSILGSGLVAALSSAFITSQWFSVVEGEVYALSSMFTGMIVWAMMRWYLAPASATLDRWLVFCAFAAGMASSVHLLGLLTIPVLPLMYYLKHEAKPTLLGMAKWFGMGFAMLAVFNFFFLPYLPQIGAEIDYVFVNLFGLPVNSGLAFFTLLLFVGLGYGIHRAQKSNSPNLYYMLLFTFMSLVSLTIYATTLIRSTANPPINMNHPADPYTLVSYVKREQYGERPLVLGPHYEAQAVNSTKTGDVYRPVNGSYEIVDEKTSPEFSSEDMMPFPRIGHTERPEQYRQWLSKSQGEMPTFNDNLWFFFRYQVGWMYYRYFMWNFVGRQNAEQGLMYNDPTKGNWLSGIDAIDKRLYDQSTLSAEERSASDRNTYYFIPLIFGLIGLIWHSKKNKNDALIVGLLFVMTGFAILTYLNGPPYEPRERDYAYAGSYVTFCIWIGLSVAALFDYLRGKMPSIAAAGIGLTALSAPVVLIQQNWDDHDRSTHFATRDYAANFLNSLEKNAILFTYGDNDTYPLWYAQEVEGIRRDVRVVNFSLLAVDWYINQLRRKINESPAIKLSISEDAIRGGLRNVVPIDPKGGAIEASQVVKFIGESHEISTGMGNVPSYCPANKIIIPVKRDIARSWGLPDSLIRDTMVIDMTGKPYLMKDDVALLDIIASNIWDRPIYYAITCRPEKFFQQPGKTKGIIPYLQLEGLGLRVVPMVSPDDSRLPVAGYGRVDVNKNIDITMNRWKFGNFDKEKTFINNSYLPSVQTMQFVYLRLAETLLKENTQQSKSKAADVAEKYLKSFPNFNFTYARNNAMAFIDIIIRGAGIDRAKTYIEDYATFCNNEVVKFSKMNGQTSFDQWAVGRLLRNKEMMDKAEMDMFTASSNDLYWFKDDYMMYINTMSSLRDQLKEQPANAYTESFNKKYGKSINKYDELIKKAESLIRASQPQQGAPTQQGAPQMPQ